MLKHRDAYERTKRMVEERKANYAESIKNQPQVEESKEEPAEMQKIESSLREFEDVVNGKANLIPLDELDEWATLLIKWRLAKQWSTEELAEKAEVNFLDFLAYEAHDYEDCPLKVMRRIKNVLKYRTPENPVNELDGLWKDPKNKKYPNESPSSTSES